MKRKILLPIILFLMMGAGLTYGAWFAETSGEQTSDSVICDKPCYLSGVLVITDGENNAKLILYDNASAASGTVVGEFTIVSTDHYGGRTWNHPVVCTNGIYADIDGTGASYTVEYILR